MERAAVARGRDVSWGPGCAREMPLGKRALDTSESEIGDEGGDGEKFEEAMLSFLTPFADLGDFGASDFRARSIAFETY